MTTKPIVFWVGMGIMLLAPLVGVGLVEFTSASPSLTVLLSSVTCLMGGIVLIVHYVAVYRANVKELKERMKQLEDGQFLLSQHRN